MIEGLTGTFFDEPTVDALAAAVTRLQGMVDRFDAQILSGHAAKFDKRNFIRQMRELIQEVLAGRSPLLCERECAAWRS